MKKIILVLCVLFILFSSCTHRENKKEISNLRTFVDTIGFAHTAMQTDSVLARIYRTQDDKLKTALSNYNNNFDSKLIISPHDDYSYVGYLYPAITESIKAKTIIFFGVAHKAKLLGLEDKIIFDSYSYWKEPYGKVKTSKFRKQIIKLLPKNTYMVNDSMQSIEHSVEAIIPFLQKKNHDIQIISILVPYMSFETMDKIAKPLSVAIKTIAEKNNLSWGKDYAFVISTDAVHYGDQDWGTSKLNFFGSDTSGYKKAIKYEHEIIDNCLTGNLNVEKIKKFINYTVDKVDYKKYKWSWCGRYSVPLGLLTSYYLQNSLNKNLYGKYIGYTTSIDHKHIKVDDLKMGVTAPANIHHWVGYAAIAYH